MGKSKLKFYLWLVQTLYENKGLTKKDLIERWCDSSQNDSKELISERSFFDYIRDVEYLFDLTIECKRSNGYKYCIVDSEEIAHNSIKDWLLNSFSVHNMMLESKNLSKRIVYEKIPSGNDFLITIVHAMKDSCCLEMTYKSFSRKEPHVVRVAPYCVKVFKQRWYLIAPVCDTAQIRIYALDRILCLERGKESFHFPEDFDVDVYFHDSYGIIVDKKIDTPECIQLKVNNRLHTCDYLRSLPLHHSQQEIYRNEEENYSVFQYYLKPTYDFMQEILAHGAEIEVLAPESLRTGCAENIKQLYKLYYPTKEE